MKVIAASSVIGLSVGLLPADGAVLRAKQRSDGTFNTSIKIREVCKTREVQLDPASLDLQGEQGPQGGVDPRSWTLPDWGKIYSQRVRLSSQLRLIGPSMSRRH